MRTTQLAGALCLGLSIAHQVAGQDVNDRPHAVIHFVRSNNVFGSACTKTVTLPNQREFNLSMGSVVNYTVYSHGRIRATVTSECPATSSTPASTTAGQVELEVVHGQEYYVDASGWKFEVATIDDVSKHMARSKNVMTHAESLDLPIDRSSLAQDKEGSGKGQCTCFMVSSKGYLITNAHCVENATELRVAVNVGNSTTQRDVVVVATDPSNDLALLKFAAPDTTLPQPPFSMRTSGVQQAEQVYALGYPFADAMGAELKVTEGIISAKSGVGGDLSKFQISAGINPGNSGGPLIDQEGNLIGVLYAKSTLAESAGYAVKASYLSAFLDSVEGFVQPELIKLPEGLSLPERIAVLKDFVWILSNR